MASFQALRLTFTFAALAALTGCAMQPVSSDVVSDTKPALHGVVMGGQQPIVGSTIQVYAAGTGGDGTASAAVLSAPTTTNSSGSFSFTIPNTYSCGSQALYITATGGDPLPGTPNNNAVLMAVIGPCSGINSNTYIQVNEVTTVAAVAALAPYMTSATSVASGSSDSAALATAFSLATELVNSSTGQAPGINLPANITTATSTTPVTAYSSPVAAVNTLADIIAACVNTGGGVAGNNNNCGTLFTYATPTGGSAPADTVTAVLDILKNPTANTSYLYALVGSTPPFVPAQTTTPSSFAVALLKRMFYGFPLDSNSDVTYTGSSSIGNGVTSTAVTPLYTLINNAQSTIDMTMYEEQDTTFASDLVAACARGVKVRVIFSEDEASANKTDFNTINGGGSNCKAVESNSAFDNTHQKTINVDSGLSTAQSAILSLNLQSQYYQSTRDFAVIENDPNDIAAIENVFAEDYSVAGTNSSTDFNYLTPAGDELIWSPTTTTINGADTAQNALTAIVNNAQSTLIMENEEMDSDDPIVADIEAACQRGVTVEIVMTNESNTYASEFSALQTAGCGVHTIAYSSSSSVLYIHAKAIIADYGLSTQTAYVGSINFSSASMEHNRELGMYVTDQPIVAAMYAILSSDYSVAPNY